MKRTFFFAILWCLGISVAQADPPGVEVELNKLEPQGDDCRAYQPSEVARAREREWSVRRAQFATRDLQARYYKRLARAIADRDETEVVAIQQEIDSYNSTRRPDQWIIIHPPSLRRAAAQELHGAEVRDVRAPRKTRIRTQEIRESRS